MKIISILIIILSIFAVIMISGCVSSKHYEEHGISFDYPSNWKAGVVYDLPHSLVSISESSQVNVKVFKYNNTNNSSLKEAYDNSVRNKTIIYEEYCYQQVSNNTITVDGVPAYELIYQIGCNNTQTRQKIREVWLEKNNNIYTIVCTVIPPEDFSLKNKAFDEIINSFHVF